MSNATTPGQVHPVVGRCLCCGFARPHVGIMISNEGTYSGPACAECIRLAHKLGYRVISSQVCHVCGGALVSGHCPACDPAPRWIDKPNARAHASATEGRR